MYNPPYLIFDYETENTHTERSRTFEQTTAQTDRHTAGIRFSPLFQPLCDKEGGRHEYLYRVRGCVKTLAQPFSIIYSPVIFSFVYAAFFSFIW